MAMHNGRSDRRSNWNWNRACVREGGSGFGQSKTPDPFELATAEVCQTGTTLWQCTMGGATGGATGIGIEPASERAAAGSANQRLPTPLNWPLRKCVKRGRPYGNAQWEERPAEQLELESSLRPRGRQRVRPIKDSRPL